MLAADAGAEIGMSIDLRGETGQEVVSIWSGDYFLQTFFLTTDWQRFDLEPFADPSAMPEDIRVEFSNDFYNPSSNFDRNVYVGSLFLNGETIDPNDGNSFSTGTWLESDGIQPGLGRGSVLNANGYLQFGPPSGSTLTVYAKGDVGQEQFTITAGSRDFEPITVTTEFQAYEFFLNEPLDPGSVRINFINDVFDPGLGIDHNLTVDRIEIDGNAFQAEGPDVLHAGFYSPETGVATGYFFTETIYANGFFQFDARTPDGERFAFDADVSQDGLIDLGPGSFATATSLGDGSFVGISQNFGFGATTPSPVVVEVFDASGNPDSVFNDGSGVDLVPVIQNAVDFDLSSLFADEVLSDSQNRILVLTRASGRDSAGNFMRESLVVRLTRDGDVDSSFGNGGIASLGPDFVFATSVDPLDRLLTVSGSTITRLDSVGQLDSSFGSGGVQTYVQPTSDARVEDLVVRDDRSFVVLLNRNSAISGDNGYVLQFNEDGSVGTWFGNNGIATVPRQFFSSNSLFTEKYRDFALDQENRLVLRASRSVIRLTGNGQLDSSFGGHGVAKLPESNLSDGEFFQSPTESGPVVDSQGRVIVALNDGFARLDSAGNLDPTFSFDGFAAAPDLGVVSFDVSDLQLDVFGRLFSPIRTGIDGPKIAVWELV